VAPSTRSLGIGQRRGVEAQTRGVGSSGCRRSCYELVAKNVARLSWIRYLLGPDRGEKARVLRR
jgi:hypothetical protein